MPTETDTLLAALAIERKLVTAEDVEACYKAQAAMAEHGIEKNLLEVMLDKRLLTRAQMDGILSATSSGRQRLGDYELIQKLGEGGMGAVYRAKQLSTDRIVALKVLPRSLARQAEFLERFRREAEIILSLDHPNIVKGVGIGAAEGYYYLAMEFVDGIDVYSLLERRGVLEERRSLEIIMQIAMGLQHAYEHSLIHRDIKPDNMLLEIGGHAKLADLGLAKVVGEMCRITQPGMVVGTPYYISPEQARGEEDIDIRSDIYALGATLYHMLTGKPPFDGTDPSMVITRRLTEELPDPRDVQPDISDDACLVLSAMMAKDVKDRYQRPGDVSKDIQRILAGDHPRIGPLPEGASSVRLRKAARPEARPRPRPEAKPRPAAKRAPAHPARPAHPAQTAQTPAAHERLFYETREFLYIVIAAVIFLALLGVWIWGG